MVTELSFPFACSIFSHVIQSFDFVCELFVLVLLSFFWHKSSAFSVSENVGWTRRSTSCLYKMNGDVFVWLSVGSQWSGVQVIIYIVQLMPPSSNRALLKFGMVYLSGISLYQFS